MKGGKPTLQNFQPDSAKPFSDPAVGPSVKREFIKVMC